jgi:hypothetical protein
LAPSSVHMTRRPFALYGSPVQFNLHPTSSGPPVSSHQTDLTPLLPRSDALNLCPDPHPQLHHRSLLSGYPPSATPQFNGVREGSVLGTGTPCNIIRMLIGISEIKTYSPHRFPKNCTARRLCMWRQRCSFSCFSE